MDERAGFRAFNLFSYCANSPVIYKDSNGSSIVLACIIIGACIGLVAGGYYGSCQASNSGYSSSDGWDYWKYVVGYGTAGAALGAGFGYCIGTIAASSATAATLGSAGSGGLVIYESWQAAEQALRNSIDSLASVAERTLQTPMGRRIVDAYNSTKGIIAEAKYGYQSLSAFIRSEIERDAWLLETGKVKVVEWHFYFSEASQTIGASAPLREALHEAGIKIIYHF